MLHFLFSACRHTLAPLVCLITLSLLPLGRTHAAGTQPPLLRVRLVAPDVFVPTFYTPTATTPALTATNGLLVRTAQGIVLIDAAPTAAQTRQLLRWVTDSLHTRVRLAMLTHAEAATPASLAVLREHNIRVYSSARTATRWRTHYPQAGGPTAALRSYTVIRAGRTRLEVFFPGPGFSPDNVVAWLPQRRVLFGGELVRTAQATSLGVVPAADLRQWPDALRTLRSRYHRARVVVPAHGPIGTLGLLTHTQALVRTAARRKPTTALNN